MSDQPKALLILGMHRSGTSVLTGVLQLLGVDLGPRLMRAGDDNEKGFWEHEDVVNLHDQMLRRFSSSWDEVCPLPDGWWNEPAALEARRALKAILERDFAGSPLWGIKDPRMCRLLPLWLPLLEEMGCEPLCVFMTRNPLEIAGSLGRRNQFSSQKSQLLWLQHMLEAELATRHLRRTFTIHHEFLADHARVCAAIAAELGLVWPRPVAAAAADIAGLIDPRLQHHKAQSPFIEGGGVIAETYEILKTTAAPEMAARLEPAHTFLREVNQLLIPLLQQRASELQGRLDELDRQFAWKLSVFQGQTRHLETQKETLARKLESRTKKVEHQVERLEKTEQKLATARHETSQIKDSLVWKLAKPFYQLERVVHKAPPPPAPAGQPSKKKEAAPAVEKPASDSAPARASTSAADSVLHEALLAPAAAPLGPKEFLVQQSQSALNLFLATGEPLVLGTSATPRVSILLVLFNRAELTFQCLRSLALIRDVPYEVVIVDNDSQDETGELLGRIQGATIIRNRENLHFLRGSNQAAAAARGEYLLFLNNDAQLLPGTLEAAFRTIESDAKIGAVGAKIILPDGKLQEAGSIIWNDGSCQGYGRGDDPLAPPYQFRRDVDFCSGAFLLTRSRLFGSGFDEAFSPAYYEETDYCVRLWKSGYRVVYEPSAAILHFEFASSASSQNAIALQVKNRATFQERHHDWLRQQPAPTGDLLRVRRRPHGQPRVLFIDDLVPHPHYGGGCPRSQQILESLCALGREVTYYPFLAISPVFEFERTWTQVYVDMPRAAEIMHGFNSTHFESFLQQRRGFYEVMIVSRPHNMKVVDQCREKHPEWFADVRIVYDAEAVFANRELEKRRLAGQEMSAAEVDALFAGEMKLIRHAAAVTAVSEQEAAVFRQHVSIPAYVIGHRLDLQPTVAKFAGRNGLLFVGSLLYEESPNVDSVRWFHDEILPLIKAKQPLLTKIVGPTTAASLFTFEAPDFILAGQQESLTPAYEAARVFIAPTRYAAGIPMKIHEAAARGIPVVATSLLARQLGWTHRVELLVADDPQSFADCCVELHENEALWQSIRDAALQRIERDCSTHGFAEALRKAITPTA
ncbi:MAG: glycosyltransferase [Chthoniobacteraceae bacterium]